MKATTEMIRTAAESAKNNARASAAKATVPNARELLNQIIDAIDAIADQCIELNATKIEFPTVSLPLSSCQISDRLSKWCREKGRLYIAAEDVFRIELTKIINNK